MAKRDKHLDHLLNDWPYEFGEVAARLVEGRDSRELIHLRIDMGVLQMETTGRPDGWKPEGYDTYYEYLLALSFEEGDQFELDGDRCLQVDREFVQFYHRRIAWLSLRDFRRAVLDADHTLALMDFSSAHSPDEDWAELHEQYRPFVLFHRTQAAALAEVDDHSPETAIEAIEEGLRRLREVFAENELEEEYADDDLIVKLGDLKEALSEHYELEPPLTQQLAEAIASEQYELAAEIRDRMASSPRHKM